MAAEGFNDRVSDEIVGTFVPIGVYWLYSCLYCLLNDLDRFRMHSRKEEEAKNSISKATVIRGVLFQQSIQAAVSILLFAAWVEGDGELLLGRGTPQEKASIMKERDPYKGRNISDGMNYLKNTRFSCFTQIMTSLHEPPNNLMRCSFQDTMCYKIPDGHIFHNVIPAYDSMQFAGNNEETPPPQVSSVLVYAKQFLVAMLVMDTWQYFMHRYMHQNKFLYRHVHSLHHWLVVPYSFGALYNHLIEGLLLDTVGGAMSFLLSGMSPRTSIFFFSFATIKTVDDHCGLWLPGNLFHLLFENNTAYHDIHHQLYGSKYNFSQPFFVMWDRILGTYMPYTLEKRADGGLRARLMKDE